jgi:hypothetical protein
MEGSGDFLQRLETALERRGAYLETQRLPLLKESFHALQTHFESLLNLLIKKGLLREDPYKYAQKITEITVPADGTILESEKIEEVSYRLSGYRSQLDHLATYYQFSVVFLDLQRLKLISGLMGYIPWKSFSDTSRSPTARALSQFLAKIRLGTDQMAAGLVKDSLTQLEKVSAQISAVLSELISFHREAFKRELRERVLPGLELGAGVVAAKRGEVMRGIRAAFAKAAPGQPYYPELVEEILEEEFGTDAESRRQKLLEQLAVKEQKKLEEKAKDEIVNREILMETVRIFSRVGTEASAAVNTLIENQLVLSSRPMTFGERIRRWISRSMGRKDDEPVYEVEYFEGADTKARTEKIGFDSFVEAARKKASFYSQLANRAGGAYLKLESATEDQLLDFVGKQISELYLLHRRMNGLNTFFLSEVPREQRSRLKGIKLQLTAINNGIVKANAKKHDYVSRKEEDEQMRRLGIH